MINYNAPWHPLRHTCVGSVYGPNFYAPIKNSKVRDSLQKIAIETKEDLDILTKTLISLGVKVEIANIDTNLTIMDFVDTQGRVAYQQCESFTLIPRSPMQPRDSVLIVGNQALLTNHEASWFTNLGLPGTISGRTFDAPLVTVVGNTLIADCCEHAWLAEFLAQTFPDRTVVPVKIGGHNDAVYSVLAPGVIVSSYHHTNYQETFPGWSVKFVENQSWNAVAEWRKFKHSNQDRWWVPEAHNNDDFADFVDTWLSNWVGYVAETVFDVNMLQIDQNTVLVNNYNDQLFDFLDKHRIDPIIVPFRHRFFWDGGLHCITNDIYREGSNECYF